MMNSDAYSDIVHLPYYHANFASQDQVGTLSKIIQCTHEGTHGGPVHLCHRRQ